MEWSHILYCVESGVAHIVLNRPEKMNALGFGAGSNRAELLEALARADEDPDVGAILISAKGKAFCAGGDMSREGRPESLMDHYLFGAGLAEFHDQVRSTRKVTVAAVHGYCIGAGLGLLAQFDICIAAVDSRFGLVEGRVGLPGATELVTKVGSNWAKYLMLTGELVDSARAEAIGLVLTVVPTETLLDRCFELARRLAVMPGEALVMNKACINSIEDLMGRASGRAIGRSFDNQTRSLSAMARAPDGRRFSEILEQEGVQGLKRARSEQYSDPWLPALGSGEKD